MNFANESIFVSALRGLLKSFAVVVGAALGLFVLMLALSGISSSVELPDKSDLTIAADADWNRKLLPDSTPVILKINIHGVIGTGDLQTEKFKTMLIDSRQGALAKDRVKGILLHINTPGGTATDSSSIYRLLMMYKERYKVPVMAFVDGYCASGGMYIACAAEKIFATSSSIVGSIGVRLGPAFNFADAMQKVGVKSLTLTEGKNKDLLNPFRPWKENEGSSLQENIEVEYKQFVDTVANARPLLTKEKLINEYGASIYAASIGAKLGYVDEGNSNYDQALKSLVSKAEITEKYQVIQIEPHQSFFKDLATARASLLEGKIKHVLPTGTFTTTEMSGQLLYLYQP